MFVFSWQVVLPVFGVAACFRPSAGISSRLLVIAELPFVMPWFESPIVGVGSCSLSLVVGYAWMLVVAGLVDSAQSSVVLGFIVDVCSPSASGSYRSSCFVNSRVVMVVTTSAPVADDLVFASQCPATPNVAGVSSARAVSVCSRAISTYSHTPVVADSPVVAVD